MKRLKFTNQLAEIILKGDKTISWRINDEKKISVGDELSLCYNDGNEFAKAIARWVKETTFGNLSYEDKEMHESFSTNEEMYKTYSKYYKTEVTQKTKLKVIKFEIIK